MWRLGEVFRRDWDCAAEFLGKIPGREARRVTSRRALLQIVVCCLELAKEPEQRRRQTDRNRQRQHPGEQQIPHRGHLQARMIRHHRARHARR